MIRKIAIAVLASGALALGGLALTAGPADAASSKGTVTQTEANKLVKEMNRQKCLTKNEARKIVHGKGQVSTVGWMPKSYSELGWNAAKGSKLSYASVVFPHGCAKEVVLWHDNTDQATQWYKGKSKPVVSVIWE